MLADICFFIPGVWGVCRLQNTIKILSHTTKTYIKSNFSLAEGLFILFFIFDKSWGFVNFKSVFLLCILYKKLFFNIHEINTYSSLNF